MNTASKSPPLHRHLPSILSLIAVTGLASFFRFYQLSTLPLGIYNDEAINGNDAVEALRTGVFRVFYPANHGREGLFINLQAISIALFGATPWSLRAVSALIGVLGVIGLFLLVRSLYEWRHALVAALLQSVIIWPVIISRLGLRPGMSATVLVWMLWALAKAMDLDGHERSERGRIVWTCVAGALLGLGLNTYISFRVTVVMAPVILLLSAERRSLRFWITRLTALALPAVAVAAPLLLYFLQHPAAFVGRSSDVSVFGGPKPLLHFLANVLLEAQMFYWRGDANWRHNFGEAPMLFWLPAVIFTVGIVVIILSVRRRTSRADRLLLIWLVVGSLPGLLSRTYEFPHGLRLILVAPAIMTIVARGALYLFDRWPAKPLMRTCIVSVCILFVIGHDYSRYFYTYAASAGVAKAFYYEPYRFAQRLLASSSQRPRYVLIPIGPDTTIDDGPLPQYAHTVAFLTATQTIAEQQRKNIHYVTPRTKPDSDSAGTELCPIPDY